MIPRASVAMSPVPIVAAEVIRESTISVLVLRALIAAVERSGVPGATLLSAAQLDPDQLDVPDGRIARAEVFRVCELASELTGDPAFGLHWAESLSQGAFAPVSHLIAHSASLRQSLESLAQFARLLGDDAFHHVVELDNEVTVRCIPLAGESPRIQRLYSEMIVAGFFRLVRQIGVHAQVERVCFAYAAPAYQAEYARVFGCTVEFEQPFSGLVCKRALLDVPAPLKDDDVRFALHSLAEERLSRITDQAPYTHRVRELLIRQHAPGRPDMTSIARSLGLSVRSLRRRLAGEGKTYNEIATETLSVVAKYLLRDGRRTIQETAYELGFSDTSTFHRAFKRWTGTTPSGYREEQLSKRAIGRASDGHQDDYRGRGLQG